MISFLHYLKRGRGLDAMSDAERDVLRVRPVGEKLLGQRFKSFDVGNDDVVPF